MGTVGAVAATITESQPAVQSASSSGLQLEARAADRSLEYWISEVHTYVRVGRTLVLRRRQKDSKGISQSV